MKKNKVYSFELNEREEEISGMVLSIGKSWVLLAYNPVDYVLDGFIFINKKFIDSVHRGSSEKFIEKVIEAKGGINTTGLPNYNLDDSKILEKQFAKEKKVIQYDFEDYSICYIGKVDELVDYKSVVIGLNPKAKWTKSSKIDFSAIATISIENDYLKSLIALNQFENKE